MHAAAAVVAAGDLQGPHDEPRLLQHRRPGKLPTVAGGGWRDRHLFPEPLGLTGGRLGVMRAAWGIALVNNFTWTSGPGVSTVSSGHMATWQDGSASRCTVQLGMRRSAQTHAVPAVRSTTMTWRCFSRRRPRQTPTSLRHSTIGFGTVQLCASGRLPLHRVQHRRCDGTLELHRFTCSNTHGAMQALSAYRASRTADTSMSLLQSQYFSAGSVCRVCAACPARH